MNEHITVKGSARLEVVIDECIYVCPLSTAFLRVSSEHSEVSLTLLADCEAVQPEESCSEFHHIARVTFLFLIIGTIFLEMLEYLHRSPLQWIFFSSDAPLYTLRFFFLIEDPPPPATAFVVFASDASMHVFTFAERPLVMFLPASSIDNFSVGDRPLTHRRLSRFCRRLSICFS